jgi:hypothetical protein
MTKIPQHYKQAEASICRACDHVVIHLSEKDKCNAWGLCDEELQDPVTGCTSYTGITIDYNGAMYRLKTSSAYPCCEAINKDGRCDHFVPVQKQPLLAAVEGPVTKGFATGLVMSVPGVWLMHQLQPETLLAQFFFDSVFYGFPTMYGAAVLGSTGRINDPNINKRTAFAAASIAAGVVVVSDLCQIPTTFGMLVAQAAPVLATVGIAKAKAVAGAAPLLLSGPVRDVKKLLRRKAEASLEAK